MLMSYLNTSVTYQFFSGVSYVHRAVELLINTLFFDTLNNTVLYSVAHDIVDPYTKVYSHCLIPFYVHINYNTWYLNISHSHPLFHSINRNSCTRFYHNCLIKDRTFKYVISDKPYKKLTSDFKKLDYLSVDIEECDGCVKSFSYLDRVMTDIQLTADHLCTFAMMFLGSKVRCLNQELDEIVFKDTDIIHSNPCNSSDSETDNE